MRLGIMQPYLFPYLGYFQLVAHVDRFVLYDDVAFIKNGWVNRNRILVDGEAHYITIPVQAALGRSIRDTPVDHGQLNVRKLRAKVEHAYRRAPYREAALALFDGALEDREAGIGAMAARSVQETARLLRLGTSVVPTSAGYGNSVLKGADRVLDLCRREGADEYANAPGGRDLYDATTFGKAGVRLLFLRPELPPYPQVGGMGFVPGLSILDVVAHAGPDQAGAMARLGALEPADAAGARPPSNTP